jgi:putative ABC transport system substrate-binding protein
VELIALNPAVIMTPDTTITVAAKKATETVPIIGVGISDPVGFGLVASLAHPEGNVTGLLSSIDKSTVKQLEILLQAVPSATRVGVMFNANNPANVAGARLLQTDKPARAIKLFPIELRSSSDIETAFQVLAGEHAGAVLVFQDGIFLFNAAQIAASALKAGVPTVFGFREHVEAGGLISYGLNRDDLWRRAGAYAAKILKGAKPGDLPVEMRPKLELVINLRTAKALGITIPPSVMAFANDVIE